jgi:hypothetical protein
VINVVPYHEFHFELCTQGLVIIIGAYLQAQGEFNSELHEESFAAFATRRVQKYMIIVFFITLG